MSRLRTAVHLVLDWDGTLTVNDTMNSLAKVVEQRIARNVNETHDTKQLGYNPDMTTWEEISDAYMQDYAAHKKAYYPQSQADDQSYRKYLASFRGIEDESRQRVAKIGYFRGVKAEDFEMNAQANLRTGDVRLREGWVELFETFFNAQPPGSKLTILSVNWSSTYIRCLLRLSAKRVYPSDATQTKVGRLLSFIENLEIIANDLEGLDLARASSGMIVGNISTSIDKVNHLPSGRSNIHCKHAVQAPGAFLSEPKQEDGTALVVYVGDSRTDYECLRAADIGLWLCDCDSTQADERFKQTFAPLELPHVQPASRIGTELDGDGWCLWVRNMYDVIDCLATLEDASVTSRNGHKLGLDSS